jgi:hypothetical protein
LGALDRPAPIILLFACDSGLAANAFSSLPGTFVDRGAAAVIASLTKFRGVHAAAAAEAVFIAMHSPGPEGLTLGTAMTAARRALIGQGLLVALLLVAHGEIDVTLSPPCVRRSHHTLLATRIHKQRSATSAAGRRACEAV